MEVEVEFEVEVQLLLLGFMNANVEVEVEVEVEVDVTVEVACLEGQVGGLAGVKRFQWCCLQAHASRRSSCLPPQLMPPAAAYASRRSSCLPPQAKPRRRLSLACGKA